MTLSTPSTAGVRQWQCLAWVGQGDEIERCGAPATIVDPVFGGPVCPQHWRTTALQDMACRECGRTIQPGEYFEFYHGIEQRQRDGTDPLICGPCLRRLLSEAIEACLRVPPDAFEEE